MKKKNCILSPLSSLIYIWSVSGTFQVPTAFCFRSVISKLIAMWTMTCSMSLSIVCLRCYLAWLMLVRVKKPDNKMIMIEDSDFVVNKRRPSSTEKIIVPIQSIEQAKRLHFLRKKRKTSNSNAIPSSQRQHYRHAIVFLVISRTFSDPIKFGYP